VTHAGTHHAKTEKGDRFHNYLVTVCLLHQAAIIP
jgi:hypothetical protein